MHAHVVAFLPSRQVMPPVVVRVSVLVTQLCVCVGTVAGVVTAGSDAVAYAVSLQV